MSLARSAGPTSLICRGDELLEMIFQCLAPSTAVRAPVVPRDRMRSAGPAGYDLLDSGDRGALFSLCLVSRRINRIVTPLLYNNLVCLQPRHTKHPDTTLRLMKCLDAHSASTAFLRVKTLHIRHRATYYHDTCPDFSALVAVCRNVEVLHVEGPAIEELLHKTPFGRPLRLAELKCITAGTVVNWSDAIPLTTTPSARLPPCLNRTALRSLNLLGCKASSLSFLRSRGVWPSLEHLGLAAPNVNAGWRIKFASLPNLKHLAIDGSLQGLSPGTVTLLHEGLPSTLESVGLAAFTIEDMRTIVSLFTHGSSTCGSLSLDFVALVRALSHERDQQGIDLAFELGRTLEAASLRMPFRLLPEDVVSETERYSRTMYGHWV